MKIQVGGRRKGPAVGRQPRNPDQAVSITPGNPPLPGSRQHPFRPSAPRFPTPGPDPETYSSSECSSLRDSQELQHPGTSFHTSSNLSHLQPASRASSSRPRSSRIYESVHQNSNGIENSFEKTRRAVSHLGYNSQRWFGPLSIIAVFTLVLVPYFIASFVSGGGWSSKTDGIDFAVRKALLTLLSTDSAEEEAWADHVVTANDGTSITIDIPATFQSRLNSLLAPLMSQHAQDIWGNTNTPVLRCKEPEVQVVSFSVHKSSRLPAVCFFGENQTRSVRDIRDLRISFPQSSSHHMLRVRVAEERPALEGSDSSPRRYHLWGRFRGRIYVDLSDTGKLALTRFCGESDIDVDIEPLHLSDVRLITVLELKRLYSLWISKSLEKKTGRDSASLFRAVLTPTEHSPTHSSIHSLRGKLKQYFVSGWNHGLEYQELKAETGPRLETYEEPNGLTFSTEIENVNPEHQNSGEASKDNQPGLHNAFSNHLYSKESEKTEYAPATGVDGERRNVHQPPSTAEDISTTGLERSNMNGPFSPGADKMPPRARGEQYIASKVIQDPMNQNPATRTENRFENHQDSIASYRQANQKTQRTIQNSKLPRQPMHVRISEPFDPASDFEPSHP